MPENKIIRTHYDIHYYLTRGDPAGKPCRQLARQSKRAGFRAFIRILFNNNSLFCVNKAGSWSRSPGKLFQLVFKRLLCPGP